MNKTFTQKRQGVYQRVTVESNRRTLPLIGWCAGMLSIVLFAGCAFVWLQSTSQEVAQSAQAKKQELETLQKQNNNLRMELAQLKSGDFISQQVQRFDLNLRQAAPGQVRRIRLDSSPTPSLDERSPLVAASGSTEEIEEGTY